MQTLCLFVIATAGYTPFARQLIASARKHFAPGHQRHFLILTDQPGDFSDVVESGDVTCRGLEHRPWPAMTLHRYRFMIEHAPFLGRFGHLFYCDADCLFQGDVGFPELGELTAVIHAGYSERPRRVLPYENRPSSSAFIGSHE